jgi:hypothetical protein
VTDFNQNGIDDLQELRSFIQNVGTDLLEDAHAAWEWLLAELAKLAKEALDALKTAIQQALGSAASGKPISEIVADTLTILYRDFETLAAQISSDVVTALVGLTTAPKAA